MTVAALIVNYNMPEAADLLVERIRKQVKRVPVDIFLIDNGSNLVPPARHTNLWIAANCQTTGGWLYGLRAVKRSQKNYFAYWFLITSAEIPEEHDPLSPMVSILTHDSRAVGVHPALTASSTTSWEHLLARGGSQPRQTWMIDNIASLYRAEWFDRQGWFDPALKYGWGIDLETCYKARRQGRSLWVDERARVQKITDIGYTMQRMNMEADTRRQLASANMQYVLANRYGGDWWKVMTEDFVEDAWR